LVGAALEREVTRFQEAVRQRLGGRPVQPFELVLAHIEEALDEDDAAAQKAAFPVTALVHAPDMMEPVRRYYRALLDPLLSKSGAAQDVRHALLAVEGMFLLRGMGFVEFSVESLAGRSRSPRPHHQQRRLAVDRSGPGNCPRQSSGRDN
jgi:hypothetical protein